MVKKQKYYVVWKGVNPGVYDSWTDCQLQIKGYDGAQYKSFETKEEAEHALASSAFHYIGKKCMVGSLSVPNRIESVVLSASCGLDVVDFFSDCSRTNHKGCL